jgi:hypothetical protein
MTQFPPVVYSETKEDLLKQYISVNDFLYEFYKATFGMVGLPLLDGLNAMLNRGLLSPSLRIGVVRLLHKVPGVPMASQLRPITLLNTDYIQTADQDVCGPPSSSSAICPASHTALFCPRTLHS